MRTRALVIGAVAALAVLIGGGLYYRAHQSARAAAARAADAAEEARRARAEAEAQRAQQAAADNSPDGIEKLRVHYLELAHEAELRWRADLVAAGATGRFAEVPRRLRVQFLDREQVQLTNVTQRPMCVAVVRIARGKEGMGYSRCGLDLGKYCGQIAGGDSVVLRMHANPLEPACVTRQLEFRIGTPLSPEPSWWSRSAFDDYARLSPERPLVAEEMPAALLRSEVARLERMLAEKDRAARWQAELKSETGGAPGGAIRVSRPN